MAELDIVIPVYNEGWNILSVMKVFRREVKTPFRVLICYDFDEDDTLSALAGSPYEKTMVEYVKNPGTGPGLAIAEGLKISRAAAVLVYMADDDYNAALIDKMMDEYRRGADVIAGSRWMKGGSAVGAPQHKEILTRIANFLMFRFGGLPTSDGTNAFRLFSRRLLNAVEVESTEGFTFTLELAAKAHRLGWKIVEIPAQWFERKDKPSRFRILDWSPAYLRWFFYVFATTWLSRGPETVRQRDGGK